MDNQTLSFLSTFLEQCDVLYNNLVLYSAKLAEPEATTVKGDLKLLAGIKQNASELQANIIASRQALIDAQQQGGTMYPAAAELKSITKYEQDGTTSIVSFFDLKKGDVFTCNQFMPKQLALTDAMALPDSSFHKASIICKVAE